MVKEGEELKVGWPVKPEKGVAEFCMLENGELLSPSAEIWLGDDDFGCSNSLPKDNPEK